eukprot:TRINITY_DN11573_c4_g1_i1.p1 TRINITY_DN11573_c4_g1~~TRINITY_DN11573_c4_g1_i1.p1  ORF type:complete len:2807 (+),score=861.87 TRINITY_DN11573_c4_g1_i1:84-8423(+)
MKRAKIVGALTSSSFKTRLEEIDGTLVQLVRQREGELSVDEAKSLIGVVLPALGGVSFGKSDRRLIQLAEVIGGTVTKGEKRAENADTLCSVVLGLLDKTEKVTAPQLAMLQTFLRGICNAQGPKTLDSLRYTRPSVPTSHTGKKYKTDEQKAAFLKELPMHGMKVRQESAATVMQQPNVQELLKRVMKLISDFLPSYKKVAKWYAGFPAVMQYVLTEANNSPNPIEALPAAFAILSLKEGNGLKLPDKYLQLISEVICKSVKSPNTKIWNYLSNIKINSCLSCPETEKASGAVFEAISAEAKRAIESVLPAFAACLSFYSVHTKKHAQSIKSMVEPTTRCLKDDKLKKHAMAVFESILANVQDLEIKKQVISGLCASLKDAKSNEEKNAIMLTLNGAVPLMLKDEKSKADATAIVKDVLYPAIKPYVTHASLELIHDCVKLTATVPDYISTILKDVATHKDDTIRYRMLYMLPDVAAVDAKKIKEIQPALAKLCKEAEKKPGFRVDALMALSVVDFPATEKWYQEGCLGHDAMLFSIENLRRPAENWQLLAGIKACQRFLPPMTGKGAPPNFSPARDIGPTTGLVLFATHPRHEVRKEAFAAIEAVIKADSKLLNSFWTSLLIVLWGVPPAKAAEAAGKLGAKKAAVKPGGKKAKPAPKVAAGAKAPTDRLNHPLVVEGKNFGKPRMPLWELAESISETAVLGGDDRREDPAAADVYAMLVNAMFNHEGVVTPELLSEIMLTVGHSAVSGPIGNYFTCCTPNMARYRTPVFNDVFVRLFGVHFNPDTMGVSFKAGHMLWNERESVVKSMLSALKEAGPRQHVRAAAGRALTFLVAHSGTDGLSHVLVQPKSKPVEPVEEDGEEPKPVVEYEEFTRLMALIEEKIEFLSKMTVSEVRIVETRTQEDVEAIVQKQLEDEDVVPRFAKDEQNVKRDKSQKGLYSKEDEEWEREMIRRKNAEKGIEDPKVAKARVEMRAKVTDIKSKLSAERDSITGYMVALIEIIRNSKNHDASHNNIPAIIPVMCKILRIVPLKSVLVKALEILEWSFLTTPVQELQAMASTLVVVTRDLLYRKDVDVTRKSPMDFSTISFVEHVMKRLRAACSGLLPAPSFSIIYPTVATVLEHVNQAATFNIICQQQTLALVSTNTGLPDLPHKTETSVSLLTIIDRTPTLSKTGIAALVSLAEHLSVDELGPITDALISPSSIVREAASAALKNYQKTPSAPAMLRYRLLSCTRDINRGVTRKAQETWKYFDLTIEEDFIDVLVPVLFSDSEEVVESISAALAAGLEKYQDMTKLALQQIFRAFDAQLSNPATVTKDFRKGTAHALLALLPLYTAPTLELITKFCCQRALVDPVESVRDVFLPAFRKIVAQHGKEHHAAILPTLQKFFQSGPPTTASPAGAAGVITPAIKESYTASIVVVMGTLSTQMEKADHVESLATKLVDISHTTSPAIALSVCETMSLIVKIKAVKNIRPKLVNKCLEKITKGNHGIAFRRCNAHALAGIIIGCHLPALHDLNILESLEDALGGKGNAKEGALASFAVFCERLDGLYEPYVIDQIQLVVGAFSDKEHAVKKAAEECSAAMMKSLSHFGVRQILPPLIASFDTESWRTKVSALNLLGQMSYCSPQQLAAALPQVMPVLVETLTDTHREVQQSAYDALRRVGGVITNPEIAAHANVLLNALRSPNTELDAALEALLYTRFTNAVDAASLAVIEPILRRGLTERVSQIKMKSAQILGSVALLVNDPDLILPYLDELMTPLKKVLLDEYPDCRSTSAKALGSLVQSLGIEQFPNLIDWCMKTLTQPDNSHVERSGAAQGVCQLITAIDSSELENYLQVIKSKTTDPLSHIREGFLQVLVYLPHTLGQAYQPHLKEMTPSVVVGLSDDVESVRNMAVKAGQTVVHLFGTKCLDQLLPPLQTGLSNPEWRVRLSSLQLLGDLLMRVATENLKGPMKQREVREELEEEEEEDEEEEEEEDEEDGGLQPMTQRGPLTLRDLRRMRSDKTTNSLITSLQDVIGTNVLGDLMANVYMLTVDLTMDVVRQAKQVWKAVVDNTPAMLRRIMEFLTPKLVEYISEDCPEHREIAGRCVGDLVSRLGDGFLPFILPVLTEGLNASNPVQNRLGSTLGFKEVVRCISRAQLAAHSNTITTAIVKAIKDEDSEVREEAGLAFDILFKNFGGRAIENLMQNLIDAIVSNDEQAMAGTLEMVKMRPRAVLQQLIPTFTECEVLSSTLSIGLGKVAELAGENLQPHIIELIPVLSNTLGQVDLDYLDDVVYAVEAVVSQAETEHMYAIMGEIRMFVQSSAVEERRGGVGLVGALVSCESLDLTDFYTTFIQNIIRLYGDSQVDVQKCALNAMKQMSAALEAAGTFIDYMGTVHGALQTAAMGTLGSGGKLPALDLGNSEDKKSLGLSTILAFYTKPLQTGDNDQREVAANGILDIIDMVSTETIKACVGDIIGPMIRKLSEVMPASTKCSMLTCISGCIRRVGSSAKQFISMLQNTFPKNLANPDCDVRRSALRSVWVLCNFQEPRLDPTLNSLVLETKGAHAAVQTALLRGLTLCLWSRPDAVIGKMIATKCQDIVVPMWERVANVSHAAAVGKAVGMLAPLLDEHVTREVVDKATGAVNRGGAMIVLGMSAWNGLLSRGVGKPGMYHQDYVKFVSDVCSVLPGMTDPDQQLATVRACRSFIEFGAINEVGTQEVMQLIKELCGLATSLIAGERVTTHTEDRLSLTLTLLLSHVPAKNQGSLNKYITQLSKVEYQDWETCSECGDDVREDE